MASQFESAAAVSICVIIALTAVSLTGPLVPTEKLGLVHTSGMLARFSPSQADPPRADLLNGTDLPDSGIGIVRQTIDLENGSSLPGNYLVAGCDYLQDDVVVPSLDRLFATCATTDSLIELNASSGQIDGTVGVGSTPTGIAFDPANEDLYVADLGGDGVLVVSAANLSVIQTILAGASPIDVAFDNATGEVYVSDFSAGNVTVIDSVNNSVITHIELGPVSQPDGIAYDSNDREIYVADSSDDRVYSISGSSNQIVGTVDLSKGVTSFGGPNALGCDPLSEMVYVSFEFDSNLSAIDTATGAVQNISLPSVGLAVTADPPLDRLYVVTDGLTIINASSLQIVGTIPTGPSPFDASANLETGVVYVTDYRADEVTAVNGSSGTLVANFYVNLEPVAAVWSPGPSEMLLAEQASGSIIDLAGPLAQPSSLATLQFGIQDLAVDPTDNNLLVSNEATNWVYAVNESGVLSWSARTGGEPDGLAYDAANQEIYVANFAGNSVTVLSASNGTILTTIGLPPPGGFGGGPDAVAVDSRSDLVFISVLGCNCGGPGNVTIINGSDNRILGGVETGGGPSAVAYDPQNNAFYVAESYTDSVLAFDASNDSFIGGTSVGGSPQGIAVDSENGGLYVANSGSGNVSVVSQDPVRLLGTIQVGPGPTAPAFDPTNGCVYIMDEKSGTVSVIGNDSFPVVFSESGLPTGTNWSIGIDSELKSSVSNTITFNEPNGAFQYRVGLVAGWQLENESGSGTIQVEDSGRSIATNWTRTEYGVRFVESGLPEGANWSVTLGGQSQYSTEASAAFLEPNGSWEYAIDSQFGAHYTETPQSGELNVSGASVSLAVVFQVNSSSGGNAGPATYWSLVILSLAISAGLATAVVSSRRRVPDSPRRASEAGR
jgi:YVTN family beta-propeller protein